MVSIGDNEIEIKIERDLQRNYTNISDNRAVILTFYTSLGKLNIKLYYTKEDYHNIHVKVENQNFWNALQKIREIVGKEFLLEVMPVKTVIEKGSFSRYQKFQQGETLWTDRATQKNVPTQKPKIVMDQL
ncbi:hypothetical protein BIY23_01590 [Wolbachia pipientis]|uniref:Uncharacterized protein n=1 Tax=Wolbachia pipientis TaxID=955 RepID=A0A1E7QL37_WOLPI|nr:hypothetical protein [Wolbachia pipientis]OEY87153.1 hypothetical protein BIY23_01590 [Wolbachia pipientis]